MSTINLNFRQDLPSNYTSYKTTPPPQKETKKVSTTTAILGTSTAGLALATAILAGKLKNKPSQTIKKNAQPIYNISVKELEKTKLYKSFADSKKTFFNFIKDSNEKAQDIKEFLFGITDNRQHSKKFIQEITSNPRDSKNILKTLINKIGGKENFKDWHQHDKGYTTAYNDFIKEAYANAKKPDELMQISPNWNYWTMTQKFGKDFSLGEVPKEIGSKDDYRKLVHNLLSGETSAKELEGGESGKRSFLINKGDKKFVLKAQNDFLVYSDGLKEALKKDDWLEDTFFNNYKENEALKSDSCYINAMIDRHLNLNNSAEATQMHYFDAKTGSVLYEFVEGTHPTEKITNKNIETFLPDTSKLGIIYNDVNQENFITRGEQIKIIDNGESQFADPLRPTTPGLQSELPNLSGRSSSLHL